jgi:hypothetical protein
MEMYTLLSAVEVEVLRAVIILPHLSRLIVYRDKVFPFPPLFFTLATAHGVQLEFPLLF